MNSDLAVRLRAELAESLRREGALVSERWIQAFKSVPRHEFLQEFFASAEDGTAWRLISADDGDDWLRMAYADEAWVTQIESGTRTPGTRSAGGQVTGIPTSSSSAPSLMARMLEALDVTSTSRVLELGTGTGYNAALLCAGLSDGQVASIDIDPGLTRQAAAVLARVGYHPLLEAADGDAPAAPGNDLYDRLIVTYGAPRIPPCWLSLLTSGSVIVTPLHRELSPGMMIRLSVIRDGTAHGRFLPFYGAFMPTRGRVTVDLPAALSADHSGEGTTISSELPALAFGPPTEPWKDYAALLLGDLQCTFVLPEGTHDLSVAQRWLVTPDGSWACQQPGAGNGSSVREGGPRRLWDELEAAIGQWRALGEPQRDRLGLTVTPDRQELWIDDPGQVIRSLL